MSIIAGVVSWWWSSSFLWKRFRASERTPAAGVVVSVYSSLHTSSPFFHTPLASLFFSLLRSCSYQRQRINNMVIISNSIRVSLSSPFPVIIIAITQSFFYKQHRHDWWCATAGLTSGVWTMKQTRIYWTYIRYRHWSLLCPWWKIMEKNIFTKIKFPNYPISCINHIMSLL